MQVLELYQRATRVPVLGRGLFSLAVGVTAPYFLTIVPTLVDGVGRGEPIFAALTYNGKAPSATRSARISGYALAEDYGELPLRFEPNLGQAGERVKFLARGDHFALFLTPNEAVLSLDVPGAAELQPRRVEQRPESFPLHRGSPHKSAILRLALLNGNANAEVSGVDRLPSVSNYFTGNNPAAWHAGIPNYAKVRYGGIYPGVDLVFRPGPPANHRHAWNAAGSCGRRSQPRIPLPLRSRGRQSVRCTQSAIRGGAIGEARTTR